MAESLSILKGPEEALHLRQNRARLFILLGPGTIWLLLFFALPLGILVALTFHAFMDAQITDIFTTDNYVRIFTEAVYAKIFFRSFVIASVVTAVTLSIGYPVAHFIARKTYQHRDLLFMALIIPFWTSVVIRTYAWKILLGNSGLVNYLLRESGLTEQPIQFLYSTPAVIIGLVHVFLPFMIMPLYASLEKLDSTFEEAAMDLGASRTRTFLRVTLPLTLPGVAMGCLLVFVLSLGSFLTPDLLGGTNSLMISNVIQDQFLQSGNWPLGGAMSVVLLVISIGFILVYNRLFNFDEETGG